MILLGLIDVPVMNSATVKDLKLGIKKKVNESEQSKMGHRHISWFVLILFLCTNNVSVHCLQCMIYRVWIDLYPIF